MHRDRLARKPCTRGKRHISGISRQGREDTCRESRNWCAPNLAYGVSKLRWLRELEQGEIKSAQKAA